MNKLYPDARYLSALAQRAGEITKQNFCLGMAKECKDDDTPLTKTDTAINQLVLDMVVNDFPKIKVIGEEGGFDPGNAEFTLLFDPVDGTIPFCRGIPVSSFCAAVIRGNEPLSAVIHDPFLDRTWLADRGKGCLQLSTRIVGNATRCQDEKAVSVSSHADILRSNICMVWWKTSGFNLHEVCEALMQEGALWMNPCSIAYWGGIVASGEYDATIFPGVNGWETAAMQLIVEEAGGKATDILGNPLVYGPNGEVNGHIISNGRIHGKLVELVRECQCPTIPD